jgi:hypothetical protein
MVLISSTLGTLGTTALCTLVGNMVIEETFLSLLDTGTPSTLISNLLVKSELGQ